MTFSMRASYSELGQGSGSGTSHRGSPAALAWARSKSTRTACMATRSVGSLTVVSRATTSTSPAVRSSWSDQALSLPLLQESSTRERFTS